jgi:hypothetical protein
MSAYTEADIGAAIDVVIEALRTLETRDPKACLLACGFVVGVEQVTRKKVTPRLIRKQRKSKSTKSGG